MEKTEDFAQGNTSSEYCQYCTDPKGKLLPYDKILSMNAKYYVDSQGITLAAAEKMAADLLKNQPAWKNV